MRKIVLLSFLICIAFYWKVFFLSQVVFPGDLLVGAYYPWLERIPIKNILISDIFSQFLIWKSLIAESFRNGSWPLWNPYSYAGYPLLANFNSGALNPFNLLMVLFGDKTGWNLLVMSQTFLTFISFYIFIRATKLSNKAAIVGSLIYSLSGFSITWLMFVNAGYAFTWIALMFFCLEKFLETRKIKFLWFISPLVFLLISAGHFQAVVYGLILFGCYSLYRFWTKWKSNSFLILGLSIFLGIAISSLQLLPTLELMKHSIRFEEGYIANYNFGLLPVQNLITFLVPDFFGNPATGNYWGPFNYHETIVYIGIFAVISLWGAIARFSKLGKFKFFIFSLIFSLILLFDNNIAQFFFQHKFPLLSTSAAGRISMITAFSLSTLSAWWFDRLNEETFVKVFKLYWWWFLIFPILFIEVAVVHKIFLPHIGSIPEWVDRTRSMLRNMIFPGVILSSYLFVILIFRKTKIFFFLVFFITLFDLFRFGLKYTSFVPREYVFPSSPSIDFIQKDSGYFRVEREKAQILPPNTWAMYRLESLSGYDPMAYIDYVNYFNLKINKAEKSYVSRYSEVDTYDSKTLGNLGVKYFLALRREESGELSDDGDKFIFRLDPQYWKVVNSSKGVFVLENVLYKDRINLVNKSGEKAGEVFLRFNSPQKLVFAYKANSDADVLISNVNYPGWKAFVNDKSSEIENNDDVFMKVPISKGSGLVVIEYKPNSFYSGLKLSIASLFILISLMILTRKLDLDHS